jgi:hypothetical protein
MSSVTMYPRISPIIPTRRADPLSDQYHAPHAEGLTVVSFVTPPSRCSSVGWLCCWVGLDLSSLRLLTERWAQDRRIISNKGPATRRAFHARHSGFLSDARANSGKARPEPGESRKVGQQDWQAWREQQEWRLRQGRGGGRRHLPHSKKRLPVRRLPSPAFGHTPGLRTGRRLLRERMRLTAHEGCITPGNARLLLGTMVVSGLVRPPSSIRGLSILRTRR